MILPVLEMVPVTPVLRRSQDINVVYADTNETDGFQLPVSSGTTFDARSYAFSGSDHQP